MIDNLGSSLWGNLLFAANPYSTPPTIPIKITQGGKNLLHRCRGSFITSYWPYTQSFYVSYLLLIVFSLFFSTPMYICNSDGSKWRCTFVYGEPKASQRYVMWELLRRVKSLGFGPWFMVGDFNGAMWQHEHFPAIRDHLSSWLISRRFFLDATYLIWAFKDCHGRLIISRWKP